MTINIPLLSEICEIPGAPGFEGAIRNRIIDEINELVDETHIDNMGNLTAIRKGSSDEKRVMAAAHMDEIGFIVKHIDANGFLRFHNLGGFDPKTLTSQRVIVHGKEDLIGVMGSKPIHIMDPAERNKAPKLTDFFIDLGLVKEQVDEIVEVGNPITRERKLIEMGDCVNCKSIDNRVSVFILIEALRALKEITIPYDFHAVFTVQEEVGLRGAHVAGHHVDPDFAINLDTTIAYDVPGAQAHEKVTELGAGTAIKILDASAISDVRMVQYLKEQASEHKINYQTELLTAGGTDTAGMQRMAPRGTIAGGISIPTRHIHQTIEMANKNDIKASIDLMVNAINHLDGFDWTPR